MSEKEIRDALMQISWYLNFKQEETISVDEIAEATGLDWGLVHNCIITLEKTQRITPDINYNDNISVGKGDRESNGIEPSVFDDDAYSAVMYIFIMRKFSKDMTQPIRVSDHPVLENLDEGVNDAIEIGWLDRVDKDRVKLTPEGVGLAGPNHSEIENLD